MFTTCISNADFDLEFYIFGTKNVWKSMELDVSVGDTLRSHGSSNRFQPIWLQIGLDCPHETRT